MNLSGSRIAITGIRDLTPEDVLRVEAAMIELLQTPRTEIRFGGARGTDTVALIAAGRHAPTTTTLTVIVPGKVAQQPAEAREAIRSYASRVIEMGLSLRDKSSYQRRNIAMIAEADGVLGFWHGRSGGTANCIAAARQIGLPVEIVSLRGI